MPADDERMAALLAALPAAEPSELTTARASALVRLSLACAEREWPNKPGHVLDGEAALRPPRELTPAFFGCFDWHSAVHGHWAMLRVLRRFPDLPEAAQVRALLDRHLTPERLASERAFFEREHSRTFERPYGWGWFALLHAEAAGFDDPDGRRWAAATSGLAALLSRRTREYIDRLTVPVRDGTHGSTAFSLVHLLDAARVTGDGELERAIVRRARDFYLADRGCPTAWEPSGEDFISPCLAEADLMRRVLPPAELGPWLERFLPPPDSDAFATLRRPVEVRDPEDPRIGHLIGLAFHRAWCFGGLAEALPAASPHALVLRRLADVHLADGLRRMSDSGYGGEHWLATFAVYALTRAP